MVIEAILFHVKPIKCKKKKLLHRYFFNVSSLLRETLVLPTKHKLNLSQTRRGVKSIALKRSHLILNVRNWLDGKITLLVSSDLQYAPLNGIALGLRETDDNNWSIIPKCINVTYISRCERVVWDLSIFNKFDHVNQLIPLSMIPLSGTYCS
jgi:hypothetical protein